MDATNDVREFLTTRRAKITPEQAGLPAYGNNRRVKGLRREEAAMLAGVSVEYYTRFERGNAAGASEDVVEGVVRALQLDETERAHLFDLVRAANMTSRPGRRRPAQERVRPVVQRVLGSITAPANVRNPPRYPRCQHARLRPVRPRVPVPGWVAEHGPVHLLTAHASDFFADWEKIANDAVAILRAEAGRDPFDQVLSNLVGELSTRSEDFRVRWAAHNVKFHRTGAKTLHHPVVGELTLDYEALDLPGDSGQRILVYCAEPGSPSRQALDLLARWATTPMTGSAHETTSELLNTKEN